MLQSVHIDILKGNAGEIGTLACMGAEVKGVESISVAGDPVDAAASLAAAHRCVVVITGKEDIVTDGKRAIFVKNGHPLMGHVVGTGCMAASAIGCFAAVEKDHLSAAAAALVSYGIAGEDAAKKASGPGTFIEHLIDAIASLDDKTIRRRALIEERTATER
jgi:hydroxyethylthiazole kinase